MSTTSAPDVSIEPMVVRDVELALLGVFGPDQLLGGRVTRLDQDLDTTPRPVVRIRLPGDRAQAVLARREAVLRDEESTPLATLSAVEAVHDGSVTDHVVVRGVLTRMRGREAREASALAISPSDLSAEDAGRFVIILGRPPVDRDEALVRETLEAVGGQILVVVADSAQAPVPTSVMVSIAGAWVDELGIADRVQIRTAPLSWRDPDSDSALAERLGHALHASRTVCLLASGDDVGAQRWHQTRVVLEAGTGTHLPGISPTLSPLLSRWRPRRSERGLVVMFTGLSGSGKSTLARDLSDWVRARGQRSLTLLDGDVVRQLLSAGLGFDRQSRDLNVRRIGFVAKEIARHGGIAVCAPIAPYTSTREAVRRMVEPVGDFVLVHVSTSLAECERRDLKGLYAMARAGTIAEFTGISDPYEEPEDADLRVDTSVLDRPAALGLVLNHLLAGGWLEAEDQ